MHRTRSIVPALLLVALAACSPAAPAKLSEQDVTDIKASVDRWVDDFLTNKKDDLTNLITDDMVLLPPNSAPMVGREASMNYMKAYPTITKFTATKDEVDGVGDVAYVRGTYSIDATLPDSTSIHDEGTYLEVHRKQADGSWRYSRLSWHSSQPLPAPAPAAGAKKSD